MTLHDPSAQPTYEDSMDIGLEQSIARELDAGERLLWSGRPVQGVRLQRSDALFIPFSLLWGGFAFFWEFMVLRDGAPLFFRLWGIPFVLVGIYLIVGRFFWDAWRRARTMYGVTDRRIIILSNAPSRSTRTLNLKGLREVTLTERRDGSGDIVFGMPPLFGWHSTRGGWPGTGARGPTFELVPRAREVYNVVRQAQAMAPPSG